jgi:hypothetical protein
MAWLDKPTGSLDFTMRDETGSTSKLSFDIPATTLASAALAAAAVVRPLLEQVTDCAILSYNVTYGSFDDAPPAAAAGSRVERKGLFQFLTAAGKKVNYQVPGVADSIVLESGQISRLNVGVAAFVTAMTAIDAVFCDSNGEDLRSLSAAYERFRSTTRNQLPSSR